MGYKMKAIPNRMAFCKKNGNSSELPFFQPNINCMNIGANIIKSTKLVVFIFKFFKALNYEDRRLFKGEYFKMIACFLPN